MRKPTLVRPLEMNFLDQINTVFGESNLNVLGGEISRIGVPTYSLLVDSNYNLAAGCAVIGTIFGVLENSKGSYISVQACSLYLNIMLITKIIII
jgi:hypothetical protein